MAAIRALLARVARLEDSEAPVKSPFERDYGTLEGFTAVVQKEIAYGHIDRGDGHCILAAVRRWHADRVWDNWH